MKEVFSIVFCIFSLLACQSNNHGKQRAEAPSFQNFKQKVLPIINGIWYQASYIDSIHQTKSPYRSRQCLAEYVELHINTQEAMGDSLIIEAPGIHEGTTFTIYFTPGKAVNSLPTNINDGSEKNNSYEISYDISGNDTSLYIIQYDRFHKINQRTKYFRAPKNSEGALQYMVNKTLFAGNYKLEGSTGKQSVITLTDDGLIRGMPGFNKYYILTDFIAGPENNFDQVCFDIQTKTQQCYAFEIHGDTINLYVVKESVKTNTIQREKLKYKLVRQ